jgi:hypothetical protein
MKLACAGIVLLFVSAAAGAVAAAPSAPTASATGIWTGRYDCAQGSTALELDVSLLDLTHLQALFYFHALPANPDVPDGCFLMQGSFDVATQVLSLTPTTWLLRPGGYVWVSLAGRLGPDGVLAGDITGPGCSEFSLTRSDTSAPMPADCQSPASLKVS